MSTFAPARLRWRSIRECLQALHRLQIVLGIESQTIEYSLHSPPKVWAINADGEVNPERFYFLPAKHPFLVPKSFEIDARFVPTRERFRQICNEAKTDDAIVETLSREEH